MSQYNSADLDSVLKTLSSLSNPAAAQNQPIHDADDTYEPPEATSTYASQAQRPHVHHQPLHPPHPQPSRPTPSQPPPTPSQQPAGPDPTTITSWPPALRHVMRTTSQNDEIQRRLRRLIQSQHDHEKQWWSGRETLLKKQAARVDKKKELDEVLRSVGAPVNENEVSATDQNTAELTNYDSKVYKASKQMAEALTLELRALKIPFFAIKQTLVHDNTEKSGDKPPDKGQISKDELAVLQRRMLELLEDLCRE